MKGKIERIDDTTLRITELPIGKWTQDYKSFLEGMMTGTDKSPSEISDFKENHTDTTVSFTVNATKEKIDEFEKEKDGLHGKFKLVTTISTNNMTLFDSQGKIHRYKTSLDILRMFFHHRLDFYVKRKVILLERMNNELKILSNKARFVEEVCRGDLVVSNRKRADLLADLKERGYDLSHQDEKKDSDVESEEDTTPEESASDAELAKGYEYLLGMKIWSLTFERAEDLRRQKAEKALEVEKLQATSPEAIWLADLDAIDEALNERDLDISAELKREVLAQNKSKARQTKKATASKKNSTKSKKKVEEVRLSYANFVFHRSHVSHSLLQSQWESESDGDSDNDSIVAYTAKSVQPKPMAKVVKTPPTLVDDTVSDLKKLSINASEEVMVVESLAPVEVLKPKATVAKTASKKSAAKKAPAKQTAPKAAPQRKAPAKKSVCLYDSSDDESDDFMGDDSESDAGQDTAPIAPAPSRARSGRAAAQKVTYVIDSSDEESDEESDF